MLEQLLAKRASILKMVEVHTQNLLKSHGALQMIESLIEEAKALIEPVKSDAPPSDPAP